MKLTRRTAILGAGAGSAALALGGAGWIATYQREDVLRPMLDRIIGPFAMDDGHFAQFGQQLVDEGMLDLLLSRSHRAVALARAQAIPVWAPAEMVQNVYNLERKVMAAFIMRTNYLQRNNSQEDVQYIGTQPCISPFANFDP